MNTQIPPYLSRRSRDKTDQLRSRRQTMKGKTQSIETSCCIGSLTARSEGSRCRYLIEEVSSALLAQIDDGCENYLQCSVRTTSLVVTVCIIFTITPAILIRCAHCLFTECVRVFIFHRCDLYHTRIDLSVPCSREKVQRWSKLTSHKDGTLADFRPVLTKHVGYGFRFFC